MIWVCPLSRVEATVVSTRAERLLSLLAPGTAMVRPTAIAEQNHLWLSLHDIAEPHDRSIDPTAVIAGEHTEHGPDDGIDRHRHDPHGE